MADRTIQEIHENLNLDPINIRLYPAAEKLWNKLLVRDPILCNSSLAENYNNLKDHNRWPRTADLITKGNPVPMYT